MGFEEIIDEIMSLDYKIRFVGIVLENTHLSKMRPNLDNLLTPEETQESIDDSLLRWETRKKFFAKLGDGLYALTEYKKVIRMTIPIKSDGLVLISLEPDGYHEILLKEILSIVHDRF